MTRKHCSRKTRNLMKFRDSYDEDYSWEDVMDALSLRRKDKKRKHKNTLKKEW
ncbi:MAG: hypothetical protein HUN04_01790 [Desulfobacter sp.]|nr:MAG: hypothetical protein HUN04_01790 [Desulfobacter sp.]